ncbi:HAD family hydrolase [Actinokineospora enzanensis]|uniref:HAD family hydrolase n=1 Tax=Actinokineospora enzanensis TaxID=155975 RepID=UPI00037A9DF0|nr:HAD-IA family hydrolase [Actinokineospora enzanensis]
MDAVAIRGVLLDFSGTLFRLEPGVESVDGLHHMDGTPVGTDRYIELITSLNTVGEKVPTGLPTGLHEHWHRRDLDLAAHRDAYLHLLADPAHRLAEGMAARLYDVMLTPAAWRPYPDAEAALRLLRARGVPVAVVSNIPWDIRDTFAHRGLADLVDAYVLSYAEGLMKPAPELFALACARIDRAPGETLMIGDSAAIDGAAAQVGCRFERVEPQATANRPDALLDALRTHGIAE